MLGVDGHALRWQIRPAQALDFRGGQGSRTRADLRRRHDGKAAGKALGLPWKRDARQGVFGQTQ
ncbi:hypothetical protein D3C78_1652870 [compost metagenome]